MSIVSLQAEHPALNTSILFFAAITYPSLLVILIRTLDIPHHRQLPFDAAKRSIPN
jgi:hypothetical protein